MDWLIFNEVSLAKIFKIYTFKIIDGFLLIISFKVLPLTYEISAVPANNFSITAPGINLNPPLSLLMLEKISLDLISVDY
jgi:hypothetical protein